MAEDKKPTPKRLTIFKVASADFVRFLVDKGGVNEDEQCPVCSSDEWTVLCPDDGGPTLRFGMPVRNRPELFYVSVFAYFCVSCGLVRSHMASVVHEWVLKNPAPDLLEQDVDGADRIEDAGDE
ncbi:hypothetical protein [Pseudomonas sp. RIT-To-2]|uniref:hypothetical protein n=1 Tax=Pseudomonas sp. RIT-To-2 TaxID=3462541 RepID=UPI002412F500